MITFSFEDFQTLGMTAACARHIQNQTEPECTGKLARVTEVHRETLTIHDGQTEKPARIQARLQRALMDHQFVLAVGDWVLVETDPFGTHWLVHRFHPITALVRRDADGRRHTLVSNVDTAFLVMGLDGDFNPQRLERYLALVRGQALLPVVVLTKADYATASLGVDGLDAKVQGLRQRVGSSIDILAIDARSDAAAQALTPYLGPGQTVVILGSSGAGKSTLTNTLLGDARQDTGAVREHDSRGKHTTTARSLHQLSSGACVIDTPGVRALSPGVDAATLHSVFDDITQLAQHCRFRDCRHADEPGCAVRIGVQADRLKNYQKLLRESRRDQQTVLERQAQLSAWKVRSKASRAKRSA